MTPTEQVLLSKAYQKVFGKPCEDHLAYELLRLIDQYNLDKAILEFDNTPNEFVRLPTPVKKAKEIALDAAIAYIGRNLEITFDPTEKKEPAGTRLVEMAETINQWLIKPDTE